jgi:hypothetical protein
VTTTATAPAKADAKPKNVTIYGRLSFPTWTAQAAYDRSQKGQYPAADVASAAPDFQLLLEPAQLDKLRNHITGVFFPYCVQQEQNGEKRDVLSAKEVADLTAQINTADFDGVYNTPLKPVHEKSAPLAPECVATVKVIGNRGTDIEQKAIVNSEDELLVPDADVLAFPIIRPIHQTVHSMYPGCYVAVTLNLYAYHNGKLPGFSAGGSVAVFKADGERFGGGVSVDEDEIFLD